MDENPNMDTDPVYPAMLYRFPGAARDAVKLQDGSYDTLIVKDLDEHDAAVAAGWFETSGEAKAAGDIVLHTEAAKRKAEADAKALEEAKALVASATSAPTRAELEAKATELGIEFSPRLGDKKLAALIEAALAD